MAKINIAASHRFHLLDLARELEKQGHDVKFYSYLPYNRLIKYGLKKENFISLFWIAIPFLALEKIFKNHDWTTFLKFSFLDFILSIFMRKCDIYIALGCVYLKSLKVAKKKYKATTILEWGSKHIYEEINAIKQTSKIEIEKNLLHKRSIKGYECADYIAIPSLHVYNSFIKNKIDPNKLILNGYGVDTKMFYPTHLADSHYYDLIMVGGWSYRKGCDILEKILVIHPELSLLHVGPIVDIDFPNQKNMKHIDAVDQTELIKYYSQAKVFILLSRTEGLAMVQVQAIACGLPIICSSNTGGEDLQNKLIDKNWITIIDDIDNIDNIFVNINKALKIAKNQLQPRKYNDINLDYFSWDAYGKRYSNNLKKMINE